MVVNAFMSLISELYFQTFLKFLILFSDKKFYDIFQLDFQIFLLGLKYNRASFMISICFFVSHIKYVYLNLVFQDIVEIIGQSTYQKKYPKQFKC